MDEHTATPKVHPTTRRRRRRSSTVVPALALAAVTVLATACPPAAPANLPACSRGASTEVATPIAETGVVPPGAPPGIDLPYEAEPMAEATSPNGVVRVWIVGERTSIGLGSSAIEFLHVYARDTTSDDPPVEVHWFGAYSELFGSSLTYNAHGWPVAANLDAIADDGSGAVVSVTYGRYYSFSGFGAYVGDPYRSFAHELVC